MTDRRAGSRGTTVKREGRVKLRARANGKKQRRRNQEEGSQGHGVVAGYMALMF